MNQPSGRTAPDSILPPAVESELRHATKHQCKLGDLVALGVKQLFIEFATNHKEREKMPKKHFPIADYPDDMRLYIARAFRDKANHVFHLDGMRYVVEVADYGRNGFLLSCEGPSPSSPASEF